MDKKESSLAVLKPYIPMISQAINEAISEFDRDPLKLFYCRRTRSSAINDLITHKAMAKFFNNPGVRVRTRSGCTYFIIRDRFLLRFKKLNKNLQTSNIPTNQSNLFLQQDSLFEELPDPMTNIFAGYTWDTANNNLSGIYLTCPLGKTNEWAYPVSLTVAEIIPITIKSPTPPNLPAKKRARAARGLNENEGHKRNEGSKQS